MDYTKKDLRNSDNSLLRRIQRQSDKVNENSLIPKESNLSLNKLSLFGDGEVPSFEEPTIKPKKTRLSLFENRKGNR